MAYPTDPIYKLVKTLMTGETTVVKTKKGVSETFIPFDEGNIDYQEYLKWVAEGNTAEEAD